MLELNPSIAKGFISLLGGGSDANNTNSGTTAPPTADVNLSFLALTEGNVLDTCFGISNSNIKSTNTEKSKKGKELLADAAYINDDMKSIAVTGYRDAFIAIVTYQKEMKQLNFITKCFQSKKIRTKAITNMRVALLAVVEAIEESP